MFGAPLNEEPVKVTQRTRRNPQKQDILAPSTSPGCYGHYARDPGTDAQARHLHYMQRRNKGAQSLEQNQIERMVKEASERKYEEHSLKKRLQRAIDDRVKEKLKAYEDTVEARRKKLQELLCKEEREFFRETVEAAQKGADQKMEQMKQKAQELKAKREGERLQLVHQKRLEQYQNRCTDLRNFLDKKNTIESKHSQLQQMRENEARRQADQELERMWNELTQKEEQAKKEREVQEMLQRRNQEKDLLKVWDMQIKGKELLRQEVERVAQEDRLKMQELSDQLRREEIEALNAKRRQRDRTAKEILEQLEIKKKLDEQRGREERALEQAFTTLAQLEIDKEKAALKDSSAEARRETAMYRRHLQELEKERKQEEKQLLELLEAHRKEIEKKQDEAKCKIAEAKWKLQCDVLNERAEQIKYKQQKAEQELKLKQAENELLRMAFETNERLQAESDRLEFQEALQYREDLRKQIEYQNLLRQRREKEELERQLAEGQKEEEKYRSLVEHLLSEDVELRTKHPFRRALEQNNCLCPKLNK